MPSTPWNEMTEAERAEIDRQEDERERSKAHFAGADEFSDPCEEYNAAYEAALIADMIVLDSGLRCFAPDERPVGTMGHEPWIRFYDGEQEAPLSNDLTAEDIAGLHRFCDPLPCDVIEAACALHDELEDGCYEREDATTLKGHWS